MVSTLNGEEVEIVLSGQRSVSDLKARISVVLRIPVDRQSLAMGAECLTSDTQLRDATHHEAVTVYRLPNLDVDEAKEELRKFIFGDYLDDCVHSIGKIERLKEGLTDRDDDGLKDKLDDLVTYFE